MTSIDAVENERMHAELDPLVGVTGPLRWSPRPIERSSVWNFCESVEDANPVYWDESIAAESRFGRLIAPPQALMALSQRPWWIPECWRDRDDVVGIGNEGTPSTLAKQRSSALGYDTATNVTRNEEYLSPFGPGDGRLGQAETLVEVSDLKATKVGVGTFLTTEIEFVAETDGRPVARARNVLLMYRPHGERKGAA